MISGSENANPVRTKKPTTTKRPWRTGRQPHYCQSIHSARRRDNPSRCRATRVSAPSKSLPKLRSRTVPFPSGFVSGPVTPSDTMPSDDTGARPVSVSKFVRYLLSTTESSTLCSPWDSSSVHL
ncbi:hypothetical protein BDV12DRAFT_148754 [Aspergillus spectabilis]